MSGTQPQPGDQSMKPTGSASTSSSALSQKRSKAGKRRSPLEQAISNLCKDMVFYLDFTRSYLSSMVDGLEADLKRLGASVEAFFAENVTCVISDSVEAWPDVPGDADKDKKTEPKSKMQSSPISKIPTSSRGARMVALFQQTEKPLLEKAKDKGLRIWPLSLVFSYLVELRLKHGVVGIGPTLCSSGERTKLMTPFVKIQDNRGSSGPTVRQKMLFPVLNIDNRLGRGGSRWTSDPRGLPLLYPMGPNEYEEVSRGRLCRLKRALEKPAEFSPASKRKFPRRNEEKTSVKAKPSREAEKRADFLGIREGVDEDDRAATGGKNDQEKQHKPGRRFADGRNHYCQYCRESYSNYLEHVSSEKHEKAVDHELHSSRLHKKVEKFFKKAPTVEDFMKKLDQIPKKAELVDKPVLLEKVDNPPDCLAEIGGNQQEKVVELPFNPASVLESPGCLENPCMVLTPRSPVEMNGRKRKIAESSSGNLLLQDEDLAKEAAENITHLVLPWQYGLVEDEESDRIVADRAATLLDPKTYHPKYAGKSVKKVLAAICPHLGDKVIKTMLANGLDPALFRKCLDVRVKKIVDPCHSGGSKFAFLVSDRKVHVALNLMRRGVADYDDTFLDRTAMCYACQNDWGKLAREIMYRKMVGKKNLALERRCRVVSRCLVMNNQVPWFCVGEHGLCAERAFVDKIHSCKRLKKAMEKAAKEVPSAGEFCEVDSEKRETSAVCAGTADEMSS